MIETINNNIYGIYSLTPLQEGMLYHRLLDEGSYSYFEQNMTKFKGKFDPKSAILAFRLVSQKHEVLRTSIVYKNVSKPYQVILRERVPEVKTYNISSLENKEQELEKIRKADMDRGFDLTNDTLLRTAWIKYSEEEYYLLLSFHHIIMDGWCMSIVLGDFLSYYQELVAGQDYADIHKKLVEQDNHVDYKDYLEWLKNQDNEKGLQYWEELLSDCTDVTDVPVFIPVVENTPKEVISLSFELSLEQNEVVEAVIRRLEITTSVFLETAIGIFLQKLNGHKNAVYAKIVSGRSAEINGIEDIVGLFINSVPVVVDAQEDITVSELLKRIMHQSAESSSYDFCSLADIQNRSLLGPNLVKLVFAFENYYMHVDGMEQDVDGLEIENVSFAEETNYDFTILGFSADKINIKFSFNRAKYSEVQIEYLLDMLKNIILYMAGNIDAKVSEISEYSDDIKKQVLIDFNQSHFFVPTEKTMIEMLEEQVKKKPDNIAVVFEDESIRYEEFWEKIQSLALRLRDLGVKNNDFVAIIAERSMEMITGIYAIIMAGAAYVPIDINYPDERVGFILKDCKPMAVLINNYELNPELNHGIPVIDLRDPKIWDKRQERIEMTNTPEDAIYCIYTSGTTGQPKGVVNCHRGMINLITWLQKTYPLTEEDAILQKTTFIFDVSASEIFWWSTIGARIVMLKPEGEKDPYTILDTIEKHQISMVDFVPSMLSEFILSLKGKQEQIRKLQSLKYVMAAGEALNAELVNEFYKLVRSEGLKIELKNLYGPTEASIYATYFDCSENCRKVLIGKPVGNYRIYILNGSRLCSIGVPGELCIAGAGLARGYLNRPELNEEKFVSDPFSDEKMYRSGDLARWMPDGNIEYLGRIDEQVKIRGFRIELGEIESRIRELEDVNDCAVIVREDDRNEKLICAYIVTDLEMVVSEIKEQLQKVLPQYMIPSYFMQIEKIPVTRNGKLDRRSLPEIKVQSENEYIAPRNETEKVICEIFEEILDHNNIGIKDDFFSLGGHSLRATRLVNLMDAKTGCRIMIKDIFIHTTPEKLALLVTGEKDDAYIPIPKADKKEYYLMSSAQKRTYLVCSLDPEGIAYNMPQFLEIKGSVHVENMKKALDAMVARHEILRTSFRLVDGVPVQKILTDVSSDFKYMEDSKTPSEELMKDFVSPFDLSKPPLVRMRLIKREASYLLMTDTHHIVSDGMSMSIFNREFNELYHHRTLPTLTHQFKDYSEWMLMRDLSDQKKYWVEQFNDEIPVLDLPTDFTRPQEQKYNGSIIGMTIEGALYQKIKERSKENSTTTYMFFLAAAMVLLGRYSRQEDVVIGSPVSARTHKDTEAILGMFTNTLALRGKPAIQKTFKEFLAEIKGSCLKAYENQEYPFEELVEEVNVKRDFSRSPLFDVMLVMQNNEQNDIRIDEDEKIGIGNTTSKFDLTFNIFEENQSFVVGLEYCTDLFKQETMERLEEHYLEVMKQISGNMDIRIGDIQIITEEEKTQILGAFNDSACDFDLSKTVVDLLEDHVRTKGDALAVRFEDEQLTYAEFNAKANILAHNLMEAGIEPGDFVAISSIRSVEMLLGIFAILKAGAAYVPVDSNYPQDRIDYMLSDCKPKLVLRYKAEMTTDFPVMELFEHRLWEGSEENPGIFINPEDQVYLIYTSGTTGRPKGVINCHRGLRNVIAWLQNEYPLMESDTILFKTTFVFDVSASEIFWWCAAGASIAILPPDDEKNPLAIADAIHKYEISVTNFVPSMFSVFVACLTGKEANIHKIRSLKYILAAGEALKAELANSFIGLVKDHSLHIELGNLYGPTEASIFSTFYNCTEISDRIPIGKPVANDNIYIMDEDQLCGIGIAGELCITGTGLAHGYLNQTELTEMKFVENPFGSGKMYRTGDLARWLSDGNIEYLGRIDEQVKIRGFRVELGEIENAVRKQDIIRDCAVIVRDDTLGDQAIYVYVVSDAKVDFEEVKKKLGKSLPEYMVPSYFAQIDRIPVTVNGKLDKKSLPAIHNKSVNTYAEPRNEIERNVCLMFGKALGVEKVGIYDSFFDLGGHSLRATILVNMIEEALNKRITIKDFFTNPTPEKIAMKVNESGDNGYSPIPRVPKKEFYAMSPAQKRIYYICSMDVAETLYNMPDYRVMNGDIQVDKAKETLQKLIDRHEILRTEFTMVDGRAVQRVLDFAEAEFEYCDDSQVPLDELFKDFVRPFNLAKAPLVRMMLVKRGEDTLLLTDMHHIVGDGVSFDIFFREYDALYEGRSLPELTCQYKDYSEWVGTRDLSEQKEYWVSRFNDRIPVLNLPLDHMRPYDQQYDGCKITKFIGDKLGKKIKHLAREHGATEYMVFLSAAMILLGKYSRQEDIIIGSPVSGRSHRDAANIIGVFINTLAMRAQPEADKRYCDFLDEIKEITLKAIENQEYPFEELLESIKVRRDLSRNPIFDVLLDLQVRDELYREENKEMFDSGEMEILDDVTAKYDITFNIIEVRDNFGISLEYCTKLFDRDSIILMIEHYIQILDQITETETVEIKQIGTCTEQEFRKITDQFNDTFHDYDRTQTVVQLFEKQVTATPDQVALIYRDQKMTYAELNKKANILANRLRKEGIKPGDFVAIYGERSIEMVLAIYAVLKSGGVYVPIDPMYPDDRIRFMLEDCSPKVMLTYLTSINQSIPVIDLKNTDIWDIEDRDVDNRDVDNRDVDDRKDDDRKDDDSDVDDRHSNDRNPPHVNCVEDPVYCIYTSGTTGKPKGVVLSNAGLVNLIYAYDEHFMLSPEDVMLQYASLCFDQSVGDIFSAGCRGAALCIVPEDVRMDTDALAACMYKNKVTVASLTPKLIEFLDVKDFPLLRVIDSGGEAGSLETLRKWSRSKVVLNTYGPTEATVNSTTAVITEDTKRITIGKPIRGSKIYIVDETESLCGIGVPGELCVAGNGLAIGYLNKPELTASKFTPNPFGEGRLYHTGDFVRWLTDGTIEFLGRIDEQVKIRGFRIELGEIESKIREIDDVKECAVIARCDANGDMAINAYIVSDEEIAIAEIYRKLSVTLPDYMIPSYMLQIDQIPLTRSGKLDPKALPEITAKSENEYVAPQKESEQVLCGLYEEILNVDKVGVRDNFFSLGGHSLSAVRLINSIEETYGERLSIKDVFTNPTVERLALCITMGDKKSEPIPPAEKKELYPMSSSQKRTYMICNLDEDDTVYNIPECRSFHEDMDPGRMREALQAMIHRHEILRTEFYLIDGEPVQKILDSVEADFIYIEDTEVDEEKLMMDFIRPFHFEKAPLVRAMLVKREQGCLLFTDMHHIIGDGVSSDIFYDEIVKIYHGEVLPELKCQYKDFSEWFRTRDLTKQEKYWLDEFADEIPVLDLPTDFTRPITQSFEGCSITRFVDGDICDRVSKLAERYDATEFMVYLSVTMLLLSKYARQEDIIIGTPVSGRTHKDTESMLGMFVNTLAMRGRPEASKTYSDFLKEVKETCLEGYENQDYPFEELVDAVDLTRDLSRNPIFSVLFGLQDNRMVDIHEMQEAPSIIENKTSKFDLTFQIIEMKECLGVSIEFCTRLFENESINMMIGHYICVLEQVIENENMTISQIEMLDAGEYERICNEYNASEFEYPSVESFMELFDEQVEKTPDHIAVVFEDAFITYRQLNEKVNALAWKLRDMGVRNNDFVALIAERSMEMVVGVYGIIKAGAAYVPIDPNYPAERVDFIMQDCKPKAVLVSKDGLHPELSSQIPIINLMEESAYDNRKHNIELINTPEDAIFCIYTSGTTGNPKGVVNCHRGMMNLIPWLQKMYPLTEEDAILQKTTFVFDVSVSELLWWCTMGARLVMLKPEDEKDPHAILEAIWNYKITVIDFVPSMLAVFLESLRGRKEQIRKLQSLKYIIAAGEALNIKIVKEFYDMVGSEGLGLTLKNLYGPTEASIYSTYFDCNKECNKVLIGKPVGNYGLYILDGTGLCGIGVPGELCITGAGLAKGYLNRPELNKEKFIDHPFGEGKMYRSGDLARWLPDGNIEYLGRMDEQVKIHGFRIELGEIESRIRELDYIKDCAVITREKNGDKAIFAYMVSDVEIDFSGVKDSLRRLIPYYMIPGYVTQVDKIPVTRNGKLDKRALPDILLKSENEFILPRNEMEESICESFKNVLNIDMVSINDDFFELGGDSIKLIRMVNYMSGQGIGISMRDVYTYRTVEKIAANALVESRGLESREVESRRSENGRTKSTELTIRINRNMKIVEKPDGESSDNHFMRLLTQYDGNIINKNTQKFDIQLRNKYFLKQKNYDICFNFDVISSCSVEKLSEALKNVIKEQAVLRAFYDKQETVFLVAEYADDWTIPVIKAEEYRHMEQDIGMENLLSNTCSREELYAADKLLVKLLIANCGEHMRVYVFAHHAVWDNECISILVERLKHFYVNENANMVEQNYFKNILDTDIHTLNHQEWMNWMSQFTDACESLKQMIEEDHSSGVFWGKKLSEEEEKAYVNNRISWTLAILQKGWHYKTGMTAEDILKIPLLLNHNGRNDENMRTLGLHLDLIPLVYDSKAPFEVYRMIESIKAANARNGFFHNYLLRQNPSFDYFAVDLNLVEVFEADSENMLIEKPMIAEDTGEKGMSIEVIYGKGYMNLQMSFHSKKLNEIEKLVGRS